MTDLAAAALYWLSGLIVGGLLVAALARRTMRRHRARIILSEDGRMLAWRGDVDVATAASWEAFQAAMDNGTTKSEENGS